MGGGSDVTGWSPISTGTWSALAVLPRSSWATAWLTTELFGEARSLTRTTIVIVTGWLFCAETLQVTTPPLTVQFPFVALAPITSSWLGTVS
jgi:hypothetical protein